MWSLSSFYIGEERVAADLAPFVMAAPTRRGRDLPRHAARGRGAPRRVLRPLHGRGDGARRRGHPRPARRDGGADAARVAHACSTISCAAIARRLQAHPDDLDLFVEGIVTYHVVIEGVLAMTGQHQILKYLEDHDIYPGLPRGLRAGRAGRAPPHRVRRALPGGRVRAGAALPRADRAQDRRAGAGRVTRVRAARHRGPERLHELTTTTRRRSTGSPTGR